MWLLVGMCFSFAVDLQQMNVECHVISISVLIEHVVISSRLSRRLATTAPCSTGTLCTVQYTVATGRVNASHDLVARPPFCQCWLSAADRLVGWWLVVVISVVGRINEVNQHRPKLVP